MLHRMSPLLAQSGHSTTEFQCPLLGVKRTFARRPPMSAFDPKRASAMRLPVTTPRRVEARHQMYLAARAITTIVSTSNAAICTQALLAKPVLGEIRVSISGSPPPRTGWQENDAT